MKGSLRGVTYSEGERDAHQEGGDQVDVPHGGWLLIENGDGLFAGWCADTEVLCEGCRKEKVEGLWIRKEFAVLNI